MPSPKKTEAFFLKIFFSSLLVCIILKFLLFLKVVNESINIKQITTRSTVKYFRQNLNMVAKLLIKFLPFKCWRKSRE